MVEVVRAEPAPTRHQAATGTPEIPAKPVLPLPAAAAVAAALEAAAAVLVMARVVGLVELRRHRQSMAQTALLAIMALIPSPVL